MDPAAARSCRRARPGPLPFYYRQSPGPMVGIALFPLSALERAGRNWAGSRGTIRRWPCRDARCGSRSLGRLVRLCGAPAIRRGARPIRTSTGRRFCPKPALTQIDLGTATALAAPVDSDRKAAWDGTWSDRPESPFHVEAAACRGRPVYFEVHGTLVPAPCSSAGAASLVGLVIGSCSPHSRSVAPARPRAPQPPDGPRRSPGSRPARGVRVRHPLPRSTLRADHTLEVVEEYAPPPPHRQPGLFAAAPCGRLPRASSPPCVAVGRIP